MSERYLAATSFWTFVALPRDGETDFHSGCHRSRKTDEEKFICSGYEEHRKARLEQRTTRSIDGTYHGCEALEFGRE